jgi:hypothetical protein
MTTLGDGTAAELAGMLDGMERHPHKPAEQE